MVARWSQAFEKRLGQSVDDPSIGRDSGYTLVELLVTVMITAILLTVVVPTVDTFVTNTDNLQSTYTALDQILPLSTTVPRYLRSAVEPAPDSFFASGVPVPPFELYTAGTMPANYGPYNISFYSNTGDQNGPELISVTVTGTAAPYTLTLTGTPATAGTCPGVNASGTGCTYNAAKTKIFDTFTNLVNGPGSGTPIFTYSTSASPPPATLSQDDTPFLTTNCTSTSCNADQINYVTVTLKGQTKKGQSTTIASSLYLLVSTYSPIVG
jgi:prepilin-type N-terminal cleavage/methylation domain-containing protein